MNAHICGLMTLTRSALPVSISIAPFPENIARRFQAAVPFGGGGCYGRKPSSSILLLPSLFSP
jgi:hypothetical protein